MRANRGGNDHRLAWGEPVDASVDNLRWQGALAAEEGFEAVHVEGEGEAEGLIEG